MWVALITKIFLNRNEPKRFLGPFTTKEKAKTEAGNNILFVGERGFVFEAEEVFPDLVPCDKCRGHGKFRVGRLEGYTIETIGPDRICENCNGTGKVPRDS